VSHIIKIAAMSALRPVRGAVGSKPAAAAEADDVDDDPEEPPPVAVGFEAGFALPVIQVLTPLMTPLDAAELNWLQILALVLVVWTLDPPRTSCRTGRETLEKVPAKLIAPIIVLSSGNPVIALRLVLFASSKPPPIWVRDGKERLLSCGQSAKASEAPVDVKLGAEKVVMTSE